MSYMIVVREHYPYVDKDCEAGVETRPLYRAHF